MLPTLALKREVTLNMTLNFSVNMKQLKIAMLCSRWNSKAATQMKILLYEEEAIMP